MHLEVLGGVRQREDVVSGVRVLLVGTKQTAERLTVPAVDVDRHVVLQTSHLLVGARTPPRRLHQTVLAERTPVRMRRLAPRDHTVIP